jgi:hypothetical protein
MQYHFVFHAFPFSNLAYKFYHNRSLFFIVKDIPRLIVSKDADLFHFKQKNAAIAMTQNILITGIKIRIGIHLLSEAEILVCLF